jgi:transposase
MRGDDPQQAGMFSYISPEERRPRDHPLRAIRVMVDMALKELSPQFARLYSHTGRPSIAPEKLLRALLQVLYTVRSERLLMEQLDYSLLFRWFVGLTLDDPIWDASTFSKNRERLLEGDVAHAFFAQVLAQARERALLSEDHFTVDGTLIETWAGQKSFKRKDTVPPRRRMIPATPASTSVASDAPMPPMPRPLIPRPGCTKRPKAKRPSWPIWGMCSWKTGTAWSSTAVSRRRPGRPSGRRPRPWPRRFPGNSGSPWAPTRTMIPVTSSESCVSCE